MHAVNSLEPWLQCQSSLTTKLKQHANNVSLTVLNQGWELADYWDKYKLQLDSGLLFKREILIAAGSEYCWYGRTVIPQLVYEQNLDLFSRLATESLGDIIFTEPRIKRLSLTSYCIDRDSIEYQWLQSSWHQNSHVLSVRFANFLIDQHYPFFLVEILLPALLRVVR
ncbi:chorismate--pyruvate lyase family protein [Legionella dresdenensis]|uniref:Chorismate--pyruvate lyase family protein n=1 Tax=Legionella dresdenensis TaxID=450200 RepID=A0ABV8CHF7_9GAMM